MNNACVLCSLSSVFFYVSDKVSVDQFKYTNARLLQSNEKFKFSQYVETNHVRWNEKP